MALGLSFAKIGGVHMSSYSMLVTNEKNHFTWEKQFESKEEFEQIEGNSEGRDFICLLCGTLKPVRTNNCRNFVQDFFLPTLFNHAVKVQRVVAKIFAILGALVLDLLTFSIRLLTSIPRVIANRMKGEHPFKKFLKSQNVDKKLLDSDYVNVKWKFEKECQGGKLPIEREELINFIERPCDGNED